MKTVTFTLEVDYDETRTDPGAIAETLDGALSAALSTHGILDEIGEVGVGSFSVIPAAKAAEAAAATCLDGFCHLCSKPVPAGEQVASFIHMATGRQIQAHPRCIPEVVYVNVHRVGQSYGGPEEGGWWYDVGEPLSATRVQYDQAWTPEAARVEYNRVKAEALTALDLQETDGKRRYSSGRANEDIVVSCDTSPADHYPKTRPTYE